MSEFVPMWEPEDGSEFFRGYMAAAEWLLDDDNPPEGGGIERNTIEGWSDDALKDAREDCANFETANAADLAAACEARPGAYDMRQAGIDYWLTRNGHGAGYWDRGLGDIGDRLTEAAHADGSRDVYQGDDGYLYF